MPLINKTPNPDEPIPLRDLASEVTTDQLLRKMHPEPRILGDMSYRDAMIECQLDLLSPIFEAVFEKHHPGGMLYDDDEYFIGVDHGTHAGDYEVSYTTEHGMTGASVVEHRRKADGSVEHHTIGGAHGLTEDGKPDYGPWWQ